MNMEEIKIKYNQNLFTHDEMDEIEGDIGDFVKIKCVSTEELSVEVPLVITIVIGTPLYFFAKGFFTKLGENFGDAISSDLIECYSKFKIRIIDLLMRNDENEPAKIRFEVHHKKIGAVVVGHVISSEPDEIEEAFDNVAELVNKAESDIISSPEDVKITNMYYSFEAHKKEWEFTYALSDKEDVFQ
jgi:hypothetical protein